MRLFERVGDLLKVRMAAFAVADVLTEVSYCLYILPETAMLLSFRFSHQDLRFL